MNRRVNRQRIMLAVLCFGISAFSVVIEYGMVSSFREALAVKSWPTTEGTILLSEIESSIATGRYTGRIEYQFTVDGRQYKSSSVRTRGTSAKRRSDVMAVVNQFPVGSTCQVFYKEASPEVSYLEAGVGIENFIIVIGPIVFGILFAVGGWELLKPEPLPTPATVVSRKKPPASP